MPFKIFWFFVALLAKIARPDWVSFFTPRPQERQGKTRTSPTFGFFGSLRAKKMRGVAGVLLVDADSSH